MGMGGGNCKIRETFESKEGPRMEGMNKAKSLVSCVGCLAP